MIATKLSAAQLNQGRNLCDREGITNVIFVEASATATGLPRDSFDLVYCRFLLPHLVDPAACLREMLAILKPGGLLVVEDGDLTSAGSTPASSLHWFADLFGCIIAFETTHKGNQPLKYSFPAAITAGALLVGTVALQLAFGNANPKNVLDGDSAFASFTNVKPGVWRHITANNLPKPGATPSATARAQIVPRPADVWPQVPDGFKVELYATGLLNPRIIRTAPNGDLFVAETNANGEITIFRGMTADGKPQQTSTFVTGLKSPFGLAFYPPGKNPQYLYVGNTGSVVRIPYKNGDLKATGPVETIVPTLPVGGHSTRDVAFSADGKKMFVSVGSGSNVAEQDPDLAKEEVHRANILQYTPDGTFVKVYAAGIRNPVGIAVNPITGELWCSVNERDALGDNLVPDYITHVQEDGFYGWPWFYMGSNQDPRHEGRHPEMKGKALIPDVLLQPHNASLELTFYDGKQFPAEYRGDIFASEHGSWNKSVRSGYEVVRIPLDKGHASGIYEDFMTGFVLPDGGVWGRPVGVATAPDGSLMVTDDGSKSVWRVSHTGK